VPARAAPASVDAGYWKDLTLGEATSCSGWIHKYFTSYVICS
jgi:hypothetical protein